MSTTPSASHDLVYFGKLPSRGDFVRSAHHSALIEHLDRWQSQTMERLATDPRWKLRYDAAPNVQFAILGTASRVGLAGHWRASQDASGRRFPFVTACSFDVSTPRAFPDVAPVALSRVWNRLDQVAGVAHAATDLVHAQASLQAPVPHEVQEPAARNALQEFLDTHTVASLEQMLAASGVKVSLRQATLALGLLLQPVMSQGAARLTKALCLPLVNDTSLRGPVAAFWLSLVLGFFRRHDVELGLYLVGHEGQTWLVLGFQGASAATLSTLIDPHTLAQEAVSVNQADWVEDEVQADYGLRKLSNYLRDPGLSLSQALATYQEVFLGV